MLNPHTVKITVTPHDNVVYFVLSYLKSGSVVASVQQNANFDVGQGIFEQNLQPLNALVPAFAQGADLELTVIAGNAAGESGPFAVPQTIQVVTVPAIPSDAVVS